MAITINASDATKLLARISRQIPFATSQAINDLAFQVQRAENAAMLATFRHPRPFTAKSVQVNRATKATLSATVFVRPEVAKYLQPYETGGVHVLPGKALLRPMDIRLDAYGQLPKSTMAILRSRQDIYIGPVQTKSGMITGVWQRLAISRAGNVRRKRLSGVGVYDATHGALKLLIRFGNAVEVTKHLDFIKRATALVTTKAGEAVHNALAKAITSMR